MRVFSMKKKIETINDDSENSIEITDSDNLFEDIGFSKGDSIKLKVKADLYARILKTVRENRYTQHTVSKIIDVPQPRVSNILRGKIDNISIDSLIDYAYKLDKTLRVEILSERRDAC